MRVAELADGAGPTARVPGVVAAAIATTANVSGGRRGSLHEVRAARKKRRVHVCVANEGYGWARRLS